MDYIYFLTIIVSILFLSVAVFQVLLSLGYPFGEYAMGGYYKVLPIKLRLVSAVNALTLLFMGFIFLQHANVINGVDLLATNILVWCFTIFLGLNTLANIFSRSKKERLIMSPLSGLTFILCILIALS